MHNFRIDDMRQQAIKGAIKDPILTQYSHRKAIKAQQSKNVIAE
jgi:hypothetical protein